MITIPAPCLDTLGNLEEDDPPVIMESRGELMPRHPMYPANGQRNGPHSGWRIVLPQSSHALLRVLYRLCGLKARDECKEPFPRPQFKVIDGVPWLQIWTSGTGHINFIGAYNARQGAAPARTFVIPMLSGDMDRIEALAEAFVWIARLNRIANTGPIHAKIIRHHFRREAGTWAHGTHDEFVSCAITDAGLTREERRKSLPEWRVHR